MNIEQVALLKDLLAQSKIYWQWNDFGEVRVYLNREDIAIIEEWLNPDEEQ